MASDHKVEDRWMFWPGHRVDDRDCLRDKSYDKRLGSEIEGRLVGYAKRLIHEENEREYHTSNDAVCAKCFQDLGMGNGLRFGKSISISLGIEIRKMDIPLTSPTTT